MRANIIPSLLPIRKLVREKINKSIVNTIIIQISVKITGLMAKGEIRDAAPRTNKILKIPLPTTFPKAISLSFFSAAEIEVTNSGNEVPIATIVKPTKASLIPHDKAISVALDTTNCPPRIIAANPSRVIKVLFPYFTFESLMALVSFLLFKPTSIM